MKAIYLDYAAATPLAPVVASAMAPFASQQFYNPSASYQIARQVHGRLELARQKVAKVLAVRPGEVIFTAGGTEANNLAIQGVLRAHPGSNVVVGAIDHKSVIEPARLFDHRFAPVSNMGLIDIKRLSTVIDDKTVLVSIGWVNNEIGIIQPLREVAKALDAIRADRQRRGITLPLYLHTDACQAGNYLALLPKKLGVDLMTLNGGKIYGPKMSGALFVNHATVLKPQILGGGQENGYRSGTESPALSVGLATALETAQHQAGQESARLSNLRDWFIGELLKLPGTQLNGPVNNRIANNVHVSFAGQDNERLMMELDERGVMCAVGSACSANSGETSHVLQAIGLSDQQARSSLRFSLGRGTTQAELKRVVKHLKELTHA